MNTSVINTSLWQGHLTQTGTYCSSPEKGQKREESVPVRALHPAAFLYRDSPALIDNFPVHLKLPSAFLPCRSWWWLGVNHFIQDNICPLWQEKRTLRVGKTILGASRCGGSPATSIQLHLLPRKCWLSHGIRGSRGSSAVLCLWQLALGDTCPGTATGIAHDSTPRLCHWLWAPQMLFEMQGQLLSSAADPCWGCSAAMGRNTSLLMTDRHYLN